MRFCVYLFLWIFSSQVFNLNAAERPCYKGHQHFIDEESFAKDGLNVVQNLEGIGQIGWWGASANQVKNSKCRARTPLEKEISNFLDSFVDTEEMISVNGVSFENESLQLVDAFKELTSRYNLIGDLETKQVDIQKQYSINPSCKKVLCAVKKIFGEKIGPKILFLKKKHGLNGSELSFQNSSRLTPNELDRMIRAVEDFPDLTFPLEKNKRFTKFKRGYSLASNGEGVVANAQITFFDRWSELGSDEMMEYTVFHELGHYIGNELELDDSSEWRSLSGWVEKNGEWRSLEKNKIISKYGQTNPAEDFAESVVTYRYNPDLLKFISPEKYRYIKETVFNGLEFTSEEQCDPKNSYFMAIDQMLESKIADFEASSFQNEDKLEEVIRLCQKESLAFILSNKDKDVVTFDECIADKAKKILASELVDELEPTLKNSKTVKDRVLKGRYQFQKGGDLKEIELVQEFAKKHLKDKMVEGMYVRDQRYSFKYPADNAQTLCESMSNSAYQNFTSIDDLFRDQLLTYRLREQFDNLFNSTCIKVQSKQIGPMTKNAIRDKIKITVHTDDEVNKMKERVRLFEKFRKNYVDSLKNNGWVYKIMFYEETQSNIEWTEEQIKKIRHVIEVHEGSRANPP